MLRTIQAYLVQVGEIVKAGQAQGRMRKDLDPGTVAVKLLGMVQPAAILWQMSDGEFDITQHSQRAWQMFVEAVQER